MQNFRDYFLSIFDKPIAKGIIEFGKTLSETKTDVFLVMARKAACLIECMEELLLTRLEAHVTTDRVLDIDLTWIKGKDVVIVDDVIVSGTTIYETIEVLTRAGAKSIRVIVIGINKDWFKSDLLTGDHGEHFLKEPYLILRNEECIKLCADIVTGLSIVPRPYSIDFPIYRDIRIKENIFSPLLTNFLWTADDITSSLQEENDVVNLTLTPNETFTSKLDNLLGFPISKTSVCKIRLYGKLTKSGQRASRNYYRMKIVPFVVFKPIKSQDIQAIFQSLLDHFPQFSELLSANFKTSTSKLRLLQHIVAGYLGKLWVKTINHLTESDITMQQDFRAMSFLYPAHVIPMVEAIASQESPIFRNADFEPIEVPFDPDPGYKSTISSLNGLSVTVKLTEAFLHLYRDKELKSRVLVRDKGKEVFSNPEYKSIVTRLKKGYPITFLYKLLEDAAVDLNVRKLVSLFLDKAIDVGIVVPITGEKDGILFRAYRHGEDVLFGEMEEKLCLRMMHSFMTSANKSEIPRLWTEKLFVLFLKIGVQKKFLQEFIYDNPPKEAVTMLSVRNYKFGQVTTVHDINPADDKHIPLYLNEDQKSSWLTSVLVERKLLIEKENGVNSRYSLITPPEDELTQSARFEAETIGDLFGSLYKNGLEKKSPRLGNKQMVLLTSCLNPHDIAASMAAELFIFQSKWRNYRRWVRRDVIDNTKLYSVSIGIRIDNASWTAINSGQDKFKGYRDKEGYAVINDISSALEHDRYMHRSWKLFWSENQEWTEESVPTQLAELINGLGQWLFEANIAFRILDVLIRKLLSLNDLTNRITRQKIVELERTKESLKNIHNQQKQEVSDGRDKEKSKEERALNTRRDELNREIKLLNEGIAIISEEIEEKFLDLDQYTTGDSSALRDIWIETKQALNTTDLRIFSDKKLINTTIQYLEILFNKTHKLLDDVDIMVSPYGKISFSQEYSHCLFISISESNDQDHRQNEKILAEVLLDFEIQTFGSKKAVNAALLSFFLFPKHLNFVGDGYLICGRGDLARSRLLNLATQIFEAMDNRPDLQMILFADLPADSTIRIPAKNTDGLKRGFLAERVFPVIDKLKSDDFGRCIYLASSSVVQPEQDFVVRDTAGYFKLESEEEIACKSPYEFKTKIYKYKPVKMDTSVDIGIITIVAPEANAIKNILEEHVRKLGTQTTRHYHQGMLPGTDGYMHRVVMTQQLIQGNESVTPAYRDLVAEFNPKLMVLFGIAGAIHEDLKLCDVMIANLVIDYDKRKVKEEDMNRGTAYRISAKIQSLINEYLNEFGERPTFQAANDSFNETFKVEVGPLGSGNAVVADRLAAIKLWLKDFNDKTLAVETEAVGFSNAFYEEELSRDFRRIGALIFRGISDHADYVKDDKWRIPAAENAAIALKQFVSLLPNLDVYLT